MKPSGLITLICAGCKEVYQSAMYGKIIRNKVFCSRKCWSKKLQIEHTRQEREAMNYGGNILPSFWESEKEEMAAFERFVRAYEDNVSEEDLRERFGGHLRNFNERLTKESKEARKRMVSNLKYKANAWAPGPLMTGFGGYF